MLMRETLDCVKAARVKLVGLLATSALAMVVYGAVEWRTPPVVSVEMGPAVVELGLRDDGVVVWRKITKATTNSPAERVWTLDTWTNGGFYHIGTNPFSIQGYEAMKIAR